MLGMVLDITLQALANLVLTIHDVIYELIESYVDIIDLFVVVIIFVGHVIFSR